MCIAVLGCPLRELVGRVGEEGEPVEQLLDRRGHVEYAARRLLWLRTALLRVLCALVCMRHHCGEWGMAGVIAIKSS
jgi:hypothetical protein